MDLPVCYGNDVPVPCDDRRVFRHHPVRDIIYGHRGHIFPGRQIPRLITRTDRPRREQMHALIGMVPPEPREPEAEHKKKERVAAGATFTWISSNFCHCPDDANEDMVKTYARVYMWYVISRTMFADGTGKTAP